MTKATKTLAKPVIAESNMTHAEFNALSKEGRRAFLNRLVGLRNKNIDSREKDARRLKDIRKILDVNTSKDSRKSAIHFLYSDIPYTAATLKNKPKHIKVVTREQWAQRLVDFQDELGNLLTKPKQFRQKNAANKEALKSEIATASFANAQALATQAATAGNAHDVDVEANNERIQNLRALQSFSQQTKPLEPWSTTSIREHLNWEEPSKVLQKSFRLGQQQKLECTQMIKHRLLLLNRSWRKHLNPNIKGAKLEDYLITLVNPNVDYEKREEMAQELFPNVPLFRNRNIVTKAPISIEELLVRMYYSYALDLQGYLHTGKRGRRKTKETLDDQLGHKIELVKQQLEQDVPKELKNYRYTNARIVPVVPGKDYHANPQVIATSEQRNLTPGERLITKAALMREPKPIQPPHELNNFFKTPVYWPITETVGIDYEATTPASSQTKEVSDESVLDLTNYYWKLNSTAMIDCTYISSDIKSSADSQAYHNKSSKEPKYGYKALVVYVPSYHLPLYVNLFPASSGDLQNLRTLWQNPNFVRHEPFIWTSDRGFHGVVKYGWCAHNRHYFLEILKSSASGKTFLEKKQLEHIKRIKKGILSLYSAKYNIEFTISEIDITDPELNWNVKDNQLICEPTKEDLEFLKSHPDLSNCREVVNEVNGCIYRNCKYAPDNNEQDWKVVYNLHPNKTKYYLITCYRKDQAQKVVTKMMERLGKRCEEISEDLSRIQQTNPELDDKGLMEALQAVDATHSPKKWEVEAGLFQVSDGRLIVDYSGFQSEYDPKGFSFFTNLHIPGLDVKAAMSPLTEGVTLDDLSRLATKVLRFCEVVYSLYRKRWTIELLFKNVKTGNAMGTLNVEGIMTAALKTVLSMIAAGVRDAYNDVLDGVRKYEAFSAHGFYVHDGNSFDQAMQVRSRGRYKDRVGYASLDTWANTVEIKFKQLFGRLPPTAYDLNQQQVNAAKPLYKNQDYIDVV